MGGAGQEEIAEPLEEGKGIVGLQGRPWIQSEGDRARARFSIGDRPRSLRGTIGPIGSRTEDHRLPQSRDVQGGGQGELLVPPAL